METIIEFIKFNSVKSLTIRTESSSMTFRVTGDHASMTLFNKEVIDLSEEDCILIGYHINNMIKDYVNDKKKKNSNIRIKPDTNVKIAREYVNKYIEKGNVPYSTTEIYNLFKKSNNLQNIKPIDISRALINKFGQPAIKVIDGKAKRVYFLSLK
jgi:hypothetical protein